MTGTVPIRTENKKGKCGVQTYQNQLVFGEHEMMCKIE